MAQRGRVLLRRTLDSRICLSDPGRRLLIPARDPAPRGTNPSLGGGPERNLPGAATRIRTVPSPSPSPTSDATPGSRRVSVVLPPRSPVSEGSRMDSYGDWSASLLGFSRERDHSHAQLRPALPRTESRPHDRRHHPVVTPGEAGVTYEEF